MVQSKWFIRVFLVGICGATLGCSDGGPARFPVEGLVTFNEETVPSGWVIFLDENSKKHNAEIGSDGLYKVELPAGDYRVGFSAPREMKETGMDAFKAQAPPPYIPVRFGQPEHSGVDAKVEAKPDNKIDFPLKLSRSRKRR